CQYGYVVPFAF
nr:immunoglobulin light chain junction region [Macaca mulatta]